MKTTRCNISVERFVPGTVPERFMNVTVAKTRSSTRYRRKRKHAMSDPKTNPTGNTEKDPDDWVSGDEPMTGAQASYLKTLCEQAHSDAFDENLTKAEASKLIDQMREKAGVAS
jgi:hypothetical protein